LRALASGTPLERLASATVRRRAPLGGHATVDARADSASFASPCGSWRACTMAGESLCPDWATEQRACPSGLLALGTLAGARTCSLERKTGGIAARAVNTVLDR